MNTPIGWLKSELDRHPIDDLRDLRIMRPPYTPRRESRLARLTGYVKRRWHYAGIGGALAILATVLGGTADSLGSPWRDLNLNLAADLLGTMLALFLIGPMIERGDMRREKVIDRFDHRTFLRQIEQSKRNIAILELWTDLLEGVYERHFRDGLNVALDNGAEVQILIMDPDTPAAQQRAHELSRNDVPARIMRNLVVFA